jgi:hypothetical protein
MRLLPPHKTGSTFEVAQVSIIRIQSVHQISEILGLGTNKMDVFS